MRFLLIFILVACSTQRELKYRFSSQKAYLSSLTDEDTVVDKIELSFKEPQVFASGMDSTFLFVKLYDKKGRLLKNVDPMDLTLAASADIDAKPFTLKKGVYKADILPRVKSKDVLMQVDWQDKVKSPMVTLRATTSPIEDALKPLSHDYIESRTFGEITAARGSSFSSSATEEFSFTNSGKNKIAKTSQSSRTFHFEYPEQARQNLALLVDDSMNERVSQTMHSYFMFFPRKKLPVWQEVGEQIKVTLPNNEILLFDKDSKMIQGGVFKEGSIDLNKNYLKRNFADLQYTGRGVLLRVNGRGASPQISYNDQKQIDKEFGASGAKDVLIINGTTDEKCLRPKADFWDDMDVSPIIFKFATDDEFEIYLQNNCGFGLPKF